MEWWALFGADRRPSPDDIAAYIATPLWDELNRFLQERYDEKPGYSYSCCSGQPGWNIKYKKAGRSLCTLYPMPGFFIALVVVGAREQGEAELMMPTCSEHTQALFNGAGAVAGAKWLMIRVTDEKTLDDVKRLIGVRRKIKKQV